MANKVLGNWTELYNGMFGDKQRFACTLVLLRCQAAETPGGKRKVRRKLVIIELVGSDQDDLDQKVVEFAEQPDVRLLALGIEGHGSKGVPLEEPLTDELLDGTASIYAQSQEASP